MNKFTLAMFTLVMFMLAFARSDAGNFSIEIGGYDRIRICRADATNEFPVGTLPVDWYTKLGITNAVIAFSNPVVMAVIIGRQSNKQQIIYQRNGVRGAMLATSNAVIDEAFIRGMTEPRGGYVMSDFPTPSVVVSISESPAVEIKNSWWDGGVSEVKDWLRANANDWDSLKFIEWSPVRRTRAGYSVRCKYRAKNLLGAYVLSDQLFTLDGLGNVTAVSDL